MEMTTPKVTRFILVPKLKEPRGKAAKDPMILEDDSRSNAQAAGRCPPQASGATPKAPLTSTGRNH